jgi:hypothetical protein
MRRPAAITLAVVVAVAVAVLTALATAAGTPDLPAAPLTPAPAAVGQPLLEPPVLASRHGLLDVTLTASRRRVSYRRPRARQLLASGRPDPDRAPVRGPMARRARRGPANRVELQQRARCDVSWLG